MTNWLFTLSHNFLVTLFHRLIFISLFAHQQNSEMGSVLLEDWSLIWDRTNRWIQLKGIDGEFEIETSPVESAIGPFIVQTGHTVVSTFSISFWPVHVWRRPVHKNRLWKQNVDRLMHRAEFWTERQNMQETGTLTCFKTDCC